MRSNNVFALALVGKGLKKDHGPITSQVLWMVNALRETLFLKKLVLSLKLYARCSLMFPPPEL